MLASCASVQVGSALATRLIESTGSGGATALRLGLAALGLLVLARPRVRAWSREQWRAALALGACMVGMNGCFYLALAHIPLGTAVTIEFLGPLALSALLSKRRRDLVWTAWALGGVLLLGGVFSTGGAALDPAGVGFALVGGVFWALYILAAGRVGAQISGLGGLAVATATAAVLAAPFGLGGAITVIGHPDQISLAIATALLASMIPYSLELGAMRSLSARTFGILLSLEPAVAAAAGWLLLDQDLPWSSALGIAMVVSASTGAALWGASSGPVDVPAELELEPLDRGAA
ncbi:EamA family transporter [Pseudenhygromyxa sp. WMMC2535]|uniref:EamA family transporter n=1 Tax=Pseudenhygromyxa sp. WMMC2535 TaxID=2712867 RepID=UPI001C3DD852